jgi:hypothetical protein
VLSVRAIVADCALAGYLRRRTEKRPLRIVERKADGTLWAASCPQDFGLCMVGLFLPRQKRGGDFHFIRVRKWRGLFIAAPRVFWRPASGEFVVLPSEVVGFKLAPWPEPVESGMIRAQQAAARAAAC